MNFTLSGAFIHKLRSGQAFAERMVAPTVSISTQVRKTLTILRIVGRNLRSLRVTFCDFKKNLLSSFASLVPKVVFFNVQVSLAVCLSDWLIFRDLLVRYLSAIHKTCKVFVR
jgi:hypothetical protein